MKEDHVDYQNMYIKLLVYTIFKAILLITFRPLNLLVIYPYLDINKHVILIFLRSEQYFNN